MQYSTANEFLPSTHIGNSLYHSFSPNCVFSSNKMMNDKENQEDPLAGLCKTASPVEYTKLNMSVEVVVCSDKHPFNYFLKHMSL